MLLKKRKISANGTPASPSIGCKLDGLCTFALYSPRTGFLSKPLIHRACLPHTCIMHFVCDWVNESVTPWLSLLIMTPPPPDCHCYDSMIGVERDLYPWSTQWGWKAVFVIKRERACARARARVCVCVLCTRPDGSEERVEHRVRNTR